MKAIAVFGWAGALALLASQGVAAAVEGLENRGAEQAAVAAIAPYPQPVRDALCEASLHPELLTRLAQVQQQSAAAFAGLLRPYGRLEQEDVWSVARYPGLLEALAAEGIDSRERIEAVLAGYPQDVVPAALRLGLRARRLLNEVAALQQDSDARFDQLAAAYPPSTRASLRLLMQFPEALASLSQDPDLAILLGDAYQQDPEGVRRQAAEVHLQAARQRAGVPRPYTEEPVAAEPPPRGSARYDYDVNGMAGPTDDDVEVNVYYDGGWPRPYPYWFGPPPWYAPPAWYAGYGWRLAPHVSAAIGFGVPWVAPRPVVFGPRHHHRTVRPYYQVQDDGRGHRRRDWR